MSEKREAFLAQVKLARYHGQPQGHYESFFQRANHPTRPLAFWIRYTLFSPHAHPLPTPLRYGALTCGASAPVAMRDRARAATAKPVLSEHLPSNTPIGEEIDHILTPSEEIGEGPDDATMEDKRKYSDWLDVRGKLAVENGEKVVHTKCRIGKRRLSQAQT